MIIFHKKVQKYIHKLKDKTLVLFLKQHIDIIMSNKEVGKILDHPFRKYKIRSYGFTHQSTNYRIAYLFNEKNNELIFLLIDSRENFYEKLKKTL